MSTPAATNSAVIPGRRAQRVEPGIHRAACAAARWIPGSCFARPGMTEERVSPLARSSGQARTRVPKNKNSLPFSGNHDYLPASRPTAKGRSARSSRHAGRGAMAAMEPQRVLSGCADERLGADVKSQRPDTPKLVSTAQCASIVAAWWPTSRRTRATAYKRETVAQGRPGVLGCTCGTCRLHFFSRRAAGVSRRLAFPAPSAFEEGPAGASLGRYQPRECECLPGRCEAECWRKNRRRPGLEPGPIRCGGCEGQNANRQRASNRSLGVWVPAFAGTTAEGVEATCSLL